MKIDRISIITACLNAERYIEETVRSVLEQTAVRSGRVELEYLVYDADSSDRTVEILDSVAHESLTVVSEPDEGLYHALQKGFGRASGQVTAYINAGDYYHRGAFDVVLDVFESHDVHWLTGLSVRCNDQSQVTKVTLPYRYRRAMLRKGLHNGATLPFVKQEATFWSTALLETVDMERLGEFRLAGDSYLWSRFATRASLTIVQAFLGTFRVHEGQLSSAMDLYRSEARQIAGPPKWTDRTVAWFDRWLWRSPDRVKLAANRSILRYDHERRRWTRG